MFFRTGHLIISRLRGTLIHHHKSNIRLIPICRCNTGIYPHIIANDLISKIIRCLLTAFLPDNTVNISTRQHTMPIILFRKQMTIIYTIHPRWTISNRIIFALTIDWITNDHTIHIYAAKQSNSCCHCRTNIIWISSIIHLKFISANDLGWISKLHMTLQIIIKIFRGNIFHRLCQFHILSL